MRLPLPDTILLIDFSTFDRPQYPLPICYTGISHPRLQQTHVTSIHTEFPPTGTFIDSSRRLWNQPTQLRNDRVQPVYMSIYDQWHLHHLLTAPQFPQTMSEYLKFYPPKRMNNDRPLKQLRDATVPLPRYRSNFYPERLVVGTCHLHKSIYGNLTGPTFTYYLTDSHVLRDKPMRTDTTIQTDTQNMYQRNSTQPIDTEQRYRYHTCYIEWPQSNHTIAPHPTATFRSQHSHDYTTVLSSIPWNHLIRISSVLATTLSERRHQPSYSPYLSDLHTLTSTPSYANTALPHIALSIAYLPALPTKFRKWLRNVPPRPATSDKNLLRPP